MVLKRMCKDTYLFITPNRFAKSYLEVDRGLPPGAAHGLRKAKKMTLKLKKMSKKENINTF
jgi:hypothetical protein